MAEETLLSAARRVVRDFNIDMNHGGLISVDTQRAIETLSKQVHVAVGETRPRREHDGGGEPAPVGEP